jgi:deoxyribodipyrimidine photolyase-related protein
MNKALLIFPHQLFEANFNLLQKYIYVLVEDELYFKQYDFHVQKLILHRASMQHYKYQLIKKSKEVLYFETIHYKNMDEMMDKLKDHHISELHYRELSDDWLNRRLIKAAEKARFKTVELQSPQFINSSSVIFEEMNQKEHLSMASFYILQRKKLGILIDSNGKPVGDKWSFDSENRKKLPKNIAIPDLYTPISNKYIDEAIVYVKQHFPHPKGSYTPFIYAINHEEAEKCLHHFINHGLLHFGAYEDAISTEHSFLFHSVLSPYLNNGLLTPDQVIKTVLEYANEIPLNSLEGFIRQVIGWREFMRGVYLAKGVKIRNSNFWDFNKKIPDFFYQGSSGIAPMDDMIKKIDKYCYAHHIERLMIAGNLMLLCEINPKEVYRWFMELFIDAYDWVMVPNVYSMSQFACGGSITTKPYLSGSNYILKMSNYKKDNWCAVWDGLYWRFINEHKEFFRSNPRLGMMAILVDKMDQKTLLNHYKNADSILSRM